MSGAKFYSNGIPVNFPFEPYPSQLNYIEKVTSALVTGKNALLESPTGTGKTLCLLCGSLAWHVHNKSRLAKGQAPASVPLQYSDGPSAVSTPVVGMAPGAAAAKPAVIVYASRTHAQLAQVVSELRTSGYTPRMSVLGSREQLCIHGRISKLRGSALNHACNATSATRGCTYKNNLESYKGTAEGVGSAPSPILDIEQLNELGKKDQICPYFFSRDNSTNADIVLLPYNYLVDSSIRATLKIAWENSIVIFDEAHNLESVATDATSFSLSSTDIATCISEMQQVVRLLQAATMEKGSSESDKADGTAAGGGNAQPPQLDRSIEILRHLFELERRLDSMPLGSIPNMGSAVGKVFPGRWLLEVMEQSGFRIELAAIYVEEISRCATYLLDDLTKAMGDMSGMGARAPDPKLGLFAKAFTKIYRGKTRDECYGNTMFYKVYLSDEQEKKSFKSYQNKQPVGASSSVGARRRVLNYWCFSTGLAVEEIKNLGVRSIILTSGTLSPMASFKEDLRLPFPIELENPHVIREREQIWVGALSTGPSGKELNSSFAQRDLSHIKDELGNTILMICQTMVGLRPLNGSVKIPQGPELKGGVLVFFPSYGALESSRKHWTESGLWAKLKSVMGNIVVETRATAGAPPVANQPQGGNHSGGGGPSKGDIFGSDSGSRSTEGTPDSAITEFENAVQSSGGKCVLMAVCRGKMSEGIDFRDQKGRVVMVTGIPYAPHVDPWVVLKREYLDSRLSGKSNPAPAAVTTKSHPYGPSARTGGIAKAGPLVLGSSHPYGKSPGTTGYSSVSSHQITAAVSASGGANAASSMTTAGHISGQAWYDQSAMRAVNQALGRVIRHKNDWGVVFFLDCRFQQPSRISQLSKWVRPMVKKYSQLAPALGEFRAFITHAMSDPLLTPVAKVEAPVRSLSIPKYVPHPSLAANNNSAFDSSNPRREITISASALGNNGSSTDIGGGSEYVDFVDPTLLMTQSQGGDFGFGITSSKHRPSAYSQSAPKSADIRSIYNDAKSTLNRAGTGASAAPVQKKSLFSALSGKGTIPSNPGSSASDAFDIDAKLSRLGAKPSNLKATETAFSRLYASAANEAPMGLSSREQPVSLVDDEDTDAQPQGRFEFLKILTEDLKLKVPGEVWAEFKQEIARVVQNPRLLESVSSVRKFVDSFFNILNKNLKGSALYGIMTRLVPLFPERHVSLYTSTARKLCQSQTMVTALSDDGGGVKPVKQEPSKSTAPNNNLIPTSEKVAATEYRAPVVLVNGMPQKSGTDSRKPVFNLKTGSDFRVSQSTPSTPRLTGSSTVKDIDNVYKRVHSELDTAYSQGESDGPAMSQSVVNTSSKRARSMAQALEKKAPRSIGISLLAPAEGARAGKEDKSSRLSIFDKVNRITAANPRAPSSASAPPNSAASKRANLICTVCNERVSDPYAARCGHICCINCWKSWLKQSNKQSCPHCRREVEYSQLTKLIIQD